MVSPLLMGRYVVPGAEGLEPELRERSRGVSWGGQEFASQVRAVVNAGRTVVLADSGDPTLFSPWFWIERALADLPLKVIPGQCLQRGKRRLGPEHHAGPRSLVVGRRRHHPRTRWMPLADDPSHLHSPLKARDLLPELGRPVPADTPIALVCEASRWSRK